MQDMEAQDTVKKVDLGLEQAKWPEQVHHDNAPAVQTSSNETQSLSADGSLAISTQQSNSKEEEDGKSPTELLRRASRERGWPGVNGLRRSRGPSRSGPVRNRALA
jgi:hypothetical protein